MILHNFNINETFILIRLDAVIKCVHLRNNFLAHVGPEQKYILIPIVGGVLASPFSQKRMAKMRKMERIVSYIKFLRAVCVYGHVHADTCVCASWYVHMHMWKQETSLGDILQDSLPCLLRQGLNGIWGSVSRLECWSGGPAFTELWLQLCTYQSQLFYLDPGVHSQVLEVICRSSV